MTRERSVTMGLLVVAAICSGCVYVVPVPPHTEMGKPIDEQTIAFIQSGTTTKADVVWELGAPDFSDRDRIRYICQHYSGVMVGAAFPPLPVNVPHFCRLRQVLTIWFDDTSTVTRYELAPGEDCSQDRGEVDYRLK